MGPSYKRNRMDMKQTAVEWLAEKYNYVTWMRNRDEISAGLADEWRKHYLDQAKEMEKAEKIKAQIEAVRAVDTYGLKHMIEHYEQQLKKETFKSE